MSPATRLPAIGSRIDSNRCQFTFPWGKTGVLQPITPLDLPVKVRLWKLTVYPRSYIRRRLSVTWIGASSNGNVLDKRASQLAGRNMSAK